MPEIEKPTLNMTIPLISDWIAVAMRGVMGKSIASPFGDEERNINNWLKETIKNPRINIITLNKAFLRKAVAESQIDLEPREIPQEAAEMAKRLENAPGLLSAFFGGLTMVGASPNTTDLAQKFDLLSNRLDQSRNDLSLFKSILLESNVLDRPYWACAVTGLDIRAELIAASTWEALVLPLDRLRVNCVLSILSLWDIEYTTESFRNFELIPIFLCLAPRYKRSPQKLRGLRYEFDTPISLLIDLCGCLFYRAKHNEWPKNIPSLDKMKELFGTERDLAKIRAGSLKLTAKKFEELLSNDLIDRSAEKIQALLPLLIVAHIWEGLTVASNGSKRRRIILEQAYMNFWHTHFDNLITNGYHPKFGDIRWPDFLKRTPKNDGLSR